MLSTSMSFLTAPKSQGKDSSAGDKKAVAVQPHELTSATRLPDKRFAPSGCSGTTQKQFSAYPGQLISLSGAAIIM